MPDKVIKSPNHLPDPSQTAKSEPLEGSVRLIARFERFAWDIAGVMSLALAVMTLLVLLAPQWTSGLLHWWGGSLEKWFGWGSVWIATTFFAVGIWLLFYRQKQKILWGRVLAIELTAFSSLALLSVIGGTSIERAESGMDGGRIGWGLATFAQIGLSKLGLDSPIWSGLLFLIFLLFGLYFGLGVNIRWNGWMRKRSFESARTNLGENSMGPILIEAPLQGSGKQPAMETVKKRAYIPQQFRKNFRLEPEAERSQDSLPSRDERLPGLDLLVLEQSNRPDERSINQTAGMIEKSLADFGIPAKVVGFRVGPTVTQFAVEPGYVEKEKGNGEKEADRLKVRVAQIASLHRDLALALAADRLRIEAPVPGRPYVGIEVPNIRTTVVRLRPILESEAFYKVNSPLAIALGRDVSGQPVVADLATMPHLLIAGTTGSGKSVCIAAITTCLVMNNTPEDLRLVMVDPKMVELVRFNGLPHLFGKVETAIERTLGVLRWIVEEMNRRYRLLEATHSRNLDTYNRKARRRHEAPLPNIVLIIDELADMMMSAPDQTEHNLIRLAQMARATGIHLVIATQRPSTDVVTGLIKANFPARISFAMASSVDSRVILDTVGAESLLGQGDMLFLPPEASTPMRTQGVMVSDQEVERVITFWQKMNPPPNVTEKPPWQSILDQDAVFSEHDDLIKQAITIVRETQRASTSLLQRRLRIGFPRAARLIDELEEMGIVGPSLGGGRERDVLIGIDDNLE